MDRRPLRPSSRDHNCEQRDAGLLADAKERAAASRTCETDPGADPTSGEYSVWTESMTQTAGRSTVRRRDRVQVRLGEDLNPLRAAEARRSELDPCLRLFAGDKQRLAAAEIAASANGAVSVDFPTPGSPPTSTRDAGTEPTAEDTVELGTPVGIRSASSTSTSTAAAPGAERPLPLKAGGALHQCSEAAAAGAAAEPATGRLAAFRAGVLESGWATERQL